jgi:hypothetical protein
MASILLTLDLIRLIPDPGDPSEILCPACHERLTLHQPDQKSPDRLLGTCAGCRAWYLIDLALAVMFRLPGEEDLRDA